MCTYQVRVDKIFWRHSHSGEGGSRGNARRLFFSIFLWVCKEIWPRPGRTKQKGLIKTYLLSANLSLCPMRAALTSFASKEVGKKGHKKRGLLGATIRSPPLFGITPARRAYRSGGAVFVSASAVASSLQKFPGERGHFKIPPKDCSKPKASLLRSEVLGDCFEGFCYLPVSRSLRKRYSVTKCGFTKFCGSAFTSVKGVPGGKPGALSFPYFFGRAKKYGPVRAGQDEQVYLKLICYLLTSTFALCRRHLLLLCQKK